MTPRKQSTEKKVYVQGRVNKTVYDEFINNALQFKGPKHGHTGLSLEEAMKLFNNYFKEFDDSTLIDVAKDMNIPPNELGIRFIRRFIGLYKLGIRFDMISDEEHLVYVKKYLEDK